MPDQDTQVRTSAPGNRISDALLQISEVMRWPGRAVSQVVQTANGVDPDALQVELVYYDAVVDEEIPARGVAYEIDDGNRVRSGTLDEDGRVIIRFDENESESIYQVSFPHFTPQLQTPVTHRTTPPWYPGLVPEVSGEVLVGPPLFRVRRGRYRFRIDLKPLVTVLHWSVGPYTPPAGGNTRRAYHIIYDDAGAEIFGAGDARFWRHNLYHPGVPWLPGANDVALDLRRTLGNRGVYSAQNPGGYGAHAGSFNTNCMGLSCSAMLGAPDVPESGRWWDPGANQSVASGLGRWMPSNDQHWRRVRSGNWQTLTPAPMTQQQVEAMIRRAGNLLHRWGERNVDANILCTHYEVRRLHRRGQHKWDITWLPRTTQETFADDANFGGNLCENDDRRYTRYEDVALGGWASRYEAQHAGDTVATNTDRVSNYLRHLVQQRINQLTP